MSFGISPTESSSSAIQRTFHTSDGGAGNLGYFQQGKKKKKEEKDEHDTLELSTKKDSEGDKEENTPDLIGSKIKTFWFKIHGVFREVVDERE